MATKMTNHPFNIRLINTAEYIAFYLLLALVIVTTYFLGQDINRILLIVILLVFILSKKDYFWFAFVFLVLFEPGTLLSADTTDKTLTLPSFKFGIVNFLFSDLFIIIAFLKALFTRERKRIFLAKYWSLLAFYLLLRFSFDFLAETDFKNSVDFLRLFIGFSLIFTIPNLFVTFSSYLKFSLLLLPSIFLIIFSQIYTLATGKFLISVFANTSIEEFYRASGIKGVEVFFFFTIALFFIHMQGRGKNNRYFYLIIFLSIFSLLFSATKSWIIILIIFTLFYYFSVIKSLPRLIINFSIFVFVFLLSYTVINEVRTASDLVVNRFTDLTVFAQGDLNTESAGRIVIRLPNVIGAISDSPLFGIGFTTQYMTLLDFSNPSPLGDYHVGNFNLLANVGFFGFTLFVVLWVKYLSALTQGFKASFGLNREKNTIIILILMFVSLLILHMTSYQIYGFTTHLRITFFVSFFYSFSGEYINFLFEERQGNLHE